MTESFPPIYNVQLCNVQKVTKEVVGYRVHSRTLEMLPTEVTNYLQLAFHSFLCYFPRSLQYSKLHIFPSSHGFEGDPLEFHQDLWGQKTKVPGHHAELQSGLNDYIILGLQHENELSCFNSFTKADRYQAIAFKVLCTCLEQ